MANLEQGVFSRVSNEHRWGPTLLIFSPEQSSLPEDQQRPDVTVSLDVGRSSYCCNWASLESVEDLKVKVSRIWKGSGPLEYKPHMAGFITQIGETEISFEGSYGQHWAPRFGCITEALPAKPLSQLIAATSYNRQLPQRSIEKLITEFMSSQPAPVTPAA